MKQASSNKNRKEVVSKIPKKLNQKYQSLKSYTKITLKNLKEACKSLHGRETEVGDQGWGWQWG